MTFLQAEVICISTSIYCISSITYPKCYDVNALCFYAPIDTNICDYWNKKLTSLNVIAVFFDC